MEIKQISITKIKPYANNAKLHPPEQVKQIAASIKEFGWQQPIVIDRNNEIVIGHGRYAAALSLGLDKVPCVRADNLTDQQIKALRLADNKTNESEWDMDLLNFELGEILDLDMTEFGFEMPEELEIEDVIEDEIPEEVETRAKAGDIWQLGRHRLIVGDSTKAETIERLLGGEAADLMITDPPYNIDYEGGTKDKLKILNDNMETHAFREFLQDAFQAANDNMRSGAAFYIWYGETEGLNFRAAAEDTGWKIREVLIWNKNTFTLSRQDYHWKHEPCLYGWKEGAHYFIDDRKQSTVFTDAEEIDPHKMKKADLVKIVEEMLADRISTTVINEDKPSKSDLHPTMKPVRLIARLVKNSSKPQEKVLDPFGGSGSTLIACEQTGRCCYTAELDEHYADVIIQRWENFTGEEAVKI